MTWGVVAVFARGQTHENCPVTGGTPFAMAAAGLNGPWSDRHTEPAGPWPVR